jgi:hypothetical protein
MRIASRSSITSLVAVASITTLALVVGRPGRAAAPVATIEVKPQLQRVERELGRVSAEQRTRADRLELAAIERDLDAMTDRLEVAAEAVVEATSDRERADAKIALANLQHEIHDRAQIEQDRSDELRSRLGE